MADNEIYEVEQILEKRDIDGEVHFLIRWKGFDSDWDTWEPLDNLQDCVKLILDYEKNIKKTLKESEKNVSSEGSSPSKQTNKNSDFKTKKLKDICIKDEKSVKASPRKNVEKIQDSSGQFKLPKKNSQQNGNLKLMAKEGKKSPEKRTSPKSPQKLADKENVQAGKILEVRSVKSSEALNQLSPKRAESFKLSATKNVDSSVKKEIVKVVKVKSINSVRINGDSRTEKKKRRNEKSQRVAKKGDTDNSEKTNRRQKLNNKLKTKGGNRLLSKSVKTIADGSKESCIVKMKKKAVSMSSRYNKNNNLRKVPRFALKVKFKPNRKGDVERKVYKTKVKSPETKKEIEIPLGDSSANNVSWCSICSYIEPSEKIAELNNLPNKFPETNDVKKKITFDKGEKDGSKARKDKVKNRTKGDRETLVKSPKLDKSNKPSRKRKAATDDDEFEVLEISESDSEDGTLYKINDVTKTIKSSPKNKRLVSVNNGDIDVKKTSPKGKSGVSVSVSESKGKELNFDKVKRKLEVRVVPMDCPSQKKKIRLIDSMKSKDPSQVVRAVSPIAFTTVKSMTASGGEATVTAAASGSSVASMETLCGDVPSYVYNPSVLPVSPSSMSYKVLLDNLPQQLHPKKVSKRQDSEENVDDDEEKVERRVSVRQSECAFRYKEIVVKKCQRYTQIWLNTHTKMKNALNPQVIQEVIAALNSARYDDSNLVMLSGLGNKFCSGIDLNFLISGDRKVVVRQMVDALRDFIKAFINFPKPIVAAVTGSAIGLGMTLLPLCDIVYASDKATFYLPYTQLAQTPEGCASFTLPQSLGMAMANELLISGRKLTAIEASNVGLVSQVFWPTSMMQEVIPRVQGLALCSSKALQTTKLLVRSHQRTKLELTNDSESSILLERWQSSECFKAMETFLSNENNYI